MKWLGGGGCGGDGRDGENRADGFGSFFWSDPAYWRNIFLISSPCTGSTKCR
jgi:hypothetical protein